MEQRELKMSKLFNYKLIFIWLAKVIAFSALGIAILTLLFIFYEAKTQKESILSFNGNCRIVNTKLAYKKGYKLETHFIKFINEDDKIESGYHIFAIDNDNKVHDISNNKKVNIEYDEYMKNFKENKKLVSFVFGEKGLDFKISNSNDFQTYASILTTYIHYLTHKYISN